MSFSYGNKIRVSIFGQSHSEKIGVVIDALPAGFSPDLTELAAYCRRRTSRGLSYTTERREEDAFEIVSGLADGVTCGAPLCALISNTDICPADYDKFRTVPRPSHADYPAEEKYHGFQDVRGGGAFSGRMTAPLVFAGGLLTQLYRQKGIVLGTRVKSIGSTEDALLLPADLTPETLGEIDKKDLPCFGDPAPLIREIENAKAHGDSVGGVIECFVLGLPVGTGETAFDSLESRISACVFAVPGVKGIAFGDGFALAAMHGSEANDPYGFDKTGAVRTASNHNGGILGGLATGMPVCFTAAMKPTPSIAAEQKTVDLSTGKGTALTVSGRHDPCIVPRAAVCIESAAAIALADLLL